MEPQMLGLPKLPFRESGKKTQQPLDEVEGQHTENEQLDGIERQQIENEQLDGIERQQTEEKQFDEVEGQQTQKEQLDEEEGQQTLKEQPDKEEGDEEESDKEEGDEEESDKDESDKDENDGDEIQQTREEQLAYVIQEEELPSDGEECALHVYECRDDTRGERIYLRAGTKSNIKLSKRRSHRACLMLNRYYNRKGIIYQTRLEIQSRHIIGALRKVIGTYYGLDFTSNSVILQEPPRCLFHYRDELQQHAQSSDNHQLKSHMQLCLEYMEKSLYQEIKIFKSFTSKEPMSPKLEHHHLWMVFKPGCLVYENKNGIERLFRLRGICDEEEDDSYKINLWELSVEFITSSKGDIGLVYHTIEIRQYDGCRPVCQLAAFPLHCHPEEKRIRHDLLERGRRFLSLCGIHHCFYDGGADMCDLKSPREYKTSYINVRHRIMIDPEEYNRNVAGSSRNFIFGTRVSESGTEAISKLSDEEIMICSCRLPGYSLELKRWGLFLVVNVTKVAYNNTAFHHLVLSEKKKELISSLLERQNHQLDDEFDDLIVGKGKGLIFLLHGPPGVGKTYTAESIADHTRRPLLKINSGELHGPGDQVETKISNLFSVATRWNSVTLLDEADVFMQKRTLYSLDTNQLVSILLRVLEYFEGILFLTTNRVETIDHAFKSRIHLAISYPPLSAGARRELWTSSIVRANHSQPPEWLTTDFLDHLAKKNVNGREIKNIVRLGASLSRNAKRDMKSADLLQGLDALEEFEIDFSKESG